MFKRFMLMLVFLAAFSTVGMGMANSASAWRGWYGGPYRSFYYGGPRVYASGFAPYRTYYAPYYAPYYGPPRVYTAYPYGYYGSYAYPGSYYYAPGVAVSVGF
jgi:hypothetical protein